MKLHEKKCLCGKDVEALTDLEIEELAAELPHWTLESRKLKRVFKLADFRGALSLANQIGAIAEEEGHHPDLHVRWGELAVEIWTHSIGSLSEADFILAAKIELLHSQD